MTSKPVRITAYSIALISIIIAGVVASYVGGKCRFTHLLSQQEFPLTCSIHRRICNDVQKLSTLDELKSRDMAYVVCDPRRNLDAGFHYRRSHTVLQRLVVYHFFYFDCLVRYPGPVVVSMVLM